MVSESEQKDVKSRTIAHSKAADAVQRQENEERTPNKKQKDREKAPRKKDEMTARKKAVKFKK
jgi:hypothetical protein